MKNPYWENICAMAERQRAKGINTYGQGIESNPADILSRIVYLQEELIDALMYCEWIKHSLIPRWFSPSERLPWELLSGVKKFLPHLRAVGVLVAIDGACVSTEAFFAEDGCFYFIEDSDPEPGEDFDSSKALNIIAWTPKPEWPF